MNAVAISSHFSSASSTSSASEREKRRAQLERQLAEIARELADLDYQDEIEVKARKSADVAVLMALMAERGITSADLPSSTSVDEPYYKFYDAKEKNPKKRMKTWNGRGKMPEALKGQEEESLIPGKKHPKRIQDLLTERAAAQSATITLNDKVIDAERPSNMEEIQRPIEDTVKAEDVGQASTQAANTETIQITPASNSDQPHPANQIDETSASSAEASVVALPT